MKATALFTVSFLLAVGILAGAARPAGAQTPAVTAPAQPAESPAAAPAPLAPPVIAPIQTPAQAQPSPPAVAPAAPALAQPPAPAPVVAAPSAEPEPAIDNPPTPPVKGKKAERTVKSVAHALFGAKKLPSIGEAAAIGYYPKGCLSGGVALPTSGPNWQVMRLSRNRFWGHPSLIRFVEKFAATASKVTGWKGILVGDLSQPRGGPTPTGHTSHQTGLDVDIWFMPMPNRRLTRSEREEISASNLVSEDWKGLNPKTWTPQHVAFIRSAAEAPEVERVLVNAAIKKELCRVAGKDVDWMKKVRPWYGHHDHIHVRLRCPDGSDQCRKQPPVGENDYSCGKSLDFWFSDKVLKPVIKFAKKKPLALADLPPACKTVLAAPAR